MQKKKNAITRTRFRAVLWNGVQRPRPAERPFGPNGTARSASIHPRNSFLERRKKKERRSALVATNPWERNEAGDGRNLVASSNPATPKYPRQSTYLANRPSLNSRGGKRKNREALNSTQHKKQGAQQKNKAPSGPSKMNDHAMRAPKVGVTSQRISVLPERKQRAGVDSTAASQGQPKQRRRRPSREIRRVEGSRYF